MHAANVLELTDASMPLNGEKGVAPSNKYNGWGSKKASPLSQHVSQQPGTPPRPVFRPLEDDDDDDYSSQGEPSTIGAGGGGRRG
jgi:hypothetical protein